jgi:hypothetical protein
MAMSIEPCPGCGCRSPIYDLGVCEYCYHMGRQPKATVQLERKPQRQVHITPAPLMPFLGDLANLGPALVRTLNNRSRHLWDLGETSRGLRTLLLQLRDGIDATLRDLEPRPDSDPVPPTPKPTPNLTNPK